MYEGSLRKDIFPKEAAGWLFDASKHGVVEAKVPIPHHHSTFGKLVKTTSSGGHVI